MVTSSGRDVLRCGRFGFRLHGALRESVKGFAQIPEGAMDARSYGIELAAEQAGNFFVLQFLEAAEKQDLTLFLRQLLKRALQQFDFLLFLGGIPGSNRREHLWLKGPLTRKLPKMVNAGVACDLVNPGAKRRHGAVTLPVFEDAKEDLLDQVFAQGPVAGQLGVEIEKWRLV